MKIIERLIFLTLLTFSFGSTYSQTAANLSVLPNPFRISSTIHFEIMQADTISLRVLELSGKIVQTYFNSTILPGGSYNINLLGDSLSDGIYFIVLSTGTTKNIAIKASKNSSTTGISDNRLNKKGLLMFPNPTNDFVTIPFEGIKTIIVTDLNGRILKSLKIDQKTISIKDLEVGQYLITILTDEGEILTTQKIVKLE